MRNLNDWTGSGAIGHVGKQNACDSNLMIISVSC